MKRVAVVGFGFMGMTHSKSILKSNNLQLVAIVDKETGGIGEKLRSDSGNFSTGDIDPALIRGIREYSDLSDCLSSEELDAVHICVHTNLHYSMAKMALESGKHVFLEKPICLNIGHGEELVQMAKGSGLVLMVAHVVRFMPPYQKLKKWVDSREFGELKFLSLSRFSGVPSWGEWRERQADFGSSGGALFDLAIHDIDFASYLLGKPKSIRSNCLPGRLSNYDYVSAMWEYQDSDLIVKVEGGNILHSSFPFQAGFVARFENASVQYTTFQPDVIQVATDDGITEVEAGNAEDGFYNEVAYFADCIEDGKEPKECMPESSLQTIRLCYDHIH